MTHELILTSVPQGINPEERGFCPVALNKEIPDALIKRLMGLSRYRHIGSPLQQSPVSYSHLTLTEYSEPLHVLSRMGDNGIDYQNQPNVLVHHVALNEAEQNPEGPAWVMSLPGFHFEHWDSPAVRFFSGRPIPKLTAPPSFTRRQQIARERRWCAPHKTVPFGNKVDFESNYYKDFVRSNDEQIALAAPPTTPCPGWFGLTGDAGWGGALADTLLTGQQTAIIFRPGQNLLPLFLESLSILPPMWLWKGTFSTYYTGLPDNVSCLWKGCVAESPEAAQLLADPSVFIIDLTKSLGKAPQGDYVKFARQGVDYLLPDKKTADTFFQSLIDSDTKEYDEGEAPQKNFPVSKDLGLPETKKFSAVHSLWGKILISSSRIQFYFLYSVMVVLILFLLFLLADQKFHLGIVYHFQTEEGITINNPLDEKPNQPDLERAETVPVSVSSPDIAAEKTEPELSELSALDDEKQKPKAPPVIPLPSVILSLSPKEIFAKPVIPISEDWQKFYDSRDDKPEIRLEITAPKTVEQESPTRAVISIEKGAYKKVKTAEEETEQPLILKIAGEINEKELRWTDLYEQQKTDWEKEKEELNKQIKEAEENLEKLRENIVSGNNPAQHRDDKKEIESLDAVQTEKKNRLSELSDLTNNKLSKAHQELLEDETTKIHFKVFFGEQAVLETE